MGADDAGRGTPPAGFAADVANLGHLLDVLQGRLRLGGSPARVGHLGAELDSARRFLDELRGIAPPTPPDQWPEAALARLMRDVRGDRRQPGAMPGPQPGDVEPVAWDDTLHRVSELGETVEQLLSVNRELESQRRRALELHERAEERAAQAELAAQGATRRAVSAEHELEPLRELLDSAWIPWWRRRRRRDRRNLQRIEYRAPTPAELPVRVEAAPAPPPLPSILSQRGIVQERATCGSCAKSLTVVHRKGEPVDWPCSCGGTFGVDSQAPAEAP